MRGHLLRQRWSEHIETRVLANENLQPQNRREPAWKEERRSAQEHLPRSWQGYKKRPSRPLAAKRRKREAR